jgi:predicted metalloprotease with PDZ domain
VWTYELGFDLPATQKTKQIAGVRAGSSAAKAGLHDGDKLRGMSIHFDDAEQPVELEVGEPSRHVSYLPHGRSVEVLELAPGDPKACDAILGEPISSSASEPDRP